MYETWKQIGNTKYEVSNLGRFRRRLKKGYKYIKPYIHRHKNSNNYVIKVNRKEQSCPRLVASAFIKPLKADEFVYHKNGIQCDNFYRNLEILTSKQLGKKTGHIARSKRVVEVKDNEIIRTWRSARKAGEKLFISRQTVCDYCNGEVKKKMFNLMWEDDYFEKIEKEGR